MTSPASFPIFDPETPITVGIIGCGWFGRVHVERMSQIPNVHIVAVSDPDPEARERVAALVPDHARDLHKPVAQYADYNDLLRHEGLDVVSINSPNKWHVEQILAALEQGLHVLSEKPLTMIPAEVDQVVAATQKANRLVAIAYQSRYRRDARLLYDALHSGKWGRVTSIGIFSNEDWVTPNVGTWRHDPARCPGGFFADANTHQLDLTFWATGLQAEWVHATTENRGTPVPIVTWGEARLVPQAHNTLTYPKEGIPFTFTLVGDAHSWSEEIRIMTERADFVMRNGRLHLAMNNKPLDLFPEAEIDPAIAALPDLPDKAFIAKLRGGPDIITAPETVWPVLRFTLAGLASAADGSKPHSA